MAKYSKFVKESVNEIPTFVVMETRAKGFVAIGGGMTAVTPRSRIAPEGWSIKRLGAITAVTSSVSASRLSDCVI